MAKILRCGLLTVLLSLLLTTQSHFLLPASAAENEQTQTGTSSKVPKKGKPGWYQKNGYKYYYDKKGKLVTGWTKISKAWYYFLKTDQGSAPAGSMAKGLTTINNNRYYFQSNGKMLTGWNKKSSGKYRYFEESGAVGVLGRLCTGKKTIGSYTYILNSNGVAKTGWISYEGAKYYGQTTKTAGVSGRLYKSCWKKIDGYYYSFTGAGKLKTSRWVGDKYYVDADGKRLINCITPDGWLVNEKGVRTVKADGWVKIGENSFYYKDGKAVTGWTTIDGQKYYLGTDGVSRTGLTEVDGKSYYLREGAVMTGWIVIGGKKYYFDAAADGAMAKNTKIKGIKINANGVATNAAGAVLIIAGHGQGDPGATSTMGGTEYMEYNYTREFADLIFSKLKSKCKKTIVVKYDDNYDCYQVNAGKKTGPSPDFASYDYVLEIHFNAAAKDYTGDGKYKGVSIMVSTSKKDYSLDADILKAIVGTGFKQYGAGVIGSSSLLNMNLCNKLGVSYGLLETAFIDDKDDMTFYKNHKDKMAAAVASTIADYFE